jgi:hypothetical protein
VAAGSCGKLKSVCSAGGKEVRDGIKMVDEMEEA